MARRIQIHPDVPLRLDRRHHGTQALGARAGGKEVIDQQVQVRLHLLLPRHGRPRWRHIARLGLERQPDSAVRWTDHHPSGFVPPELGAPDRFPCATLNRMSETLAAAHASDYPAGRIAEMVHNIIEAHRSGTLPAIAQLGHPVLRMPGFAFEGQLDDDLLRSFLATMRATMHDAPGVGLAAPQIGVPLRIAVLEDRYPVDPEVGVERERTPLEYFAAINPSYAPRGPRTAAFYEGCLSFNGYQGVVARPAVVEAAYTDDAGAAVVRELAGWPARIFQHETDHLDGIVYIDRAETRSLASTVEYLERWSEPGIANARAALGF